MHLAPIKSCRPLEKGGYLLTLNNNDTALWLEEIARRGSMVPSLDLAATSACQSRWQDLAMPRNALGIWTHVVERLAGMTGHMVPSIRSPHALLFGADHGVAHEGISAYPQTVTEEIACAAAMGVSVSGVLSRQQNIPLSVFDVGLARPPRHPAVIVKAQARSTANFVHTAAMTLNQAIGSVYCGLSETDRILDQGADLIVLGEIGIGNTTSAAAITALLLDEAPDQIVGVGTGIPEDIRQHKISVILTALKRITHPLNVWAVMQEVGGFELAALAGSMLAAASRRTPVLLDGMVTAAAALWIARQYPEISQYLIAPSQSPEPAHPPLLKALHTNPLSDWGIRAGEAAGALMVLPSLRAALTLFAESSTFEDARVTDPYVHEPLAERAPATDTPPTVTDFSKEEQQAVYKAIYGRRDIRVYLPDPLPAHLLSRILDAGHHAPSVGFMQPWDFVVITHPDLKQRLASIVDKERIRASQSFDGIRQDHYLRLKVEGLVRAPVVICVTNNSKRGGPNVLGRSTRPETDLMSTACAIQNMWLAARAEGLGMGWVSIYPKEPVQTTLNLPLHIDPVALLTLGYTPYFPSQPVLQQVGWRQRRDPSLVIHDDGWRARLNPDEPNS